MQSHERFKISQRNRLVIWVGVIIFVIFILLLVAITMKEYLPEALRIVVAFLGGIGIGRGLNSELLPHQSNQ